MAGIIDVRSPRGAIAADGTERLAQSIAAGRAISTDWRGRVTSWPGTASLIAGRHADDALGHFLFDGILETPAPGSGAEEWLWFLGGGDALPRAAAQVRVTVNHPLHRLAAQATFVPIGRDEAFDTALFLETAERTTPDVCDYPRLRSALRRADAGAVADLHPDDIVGTLVVLDLV